MTALEKYHPQWVYYKDQGADEEPFEIPFSFQVPADGVVHPDLPIQIDNEDTRIRGIFFNRLKATVTVSGAVSVAPVQIDTSSQVSGLAGVGVCSQGAYQTANGNLYVMLGTQNGAPDTANVFRSTDGGTTWVQQDAVNSPVTLGNPQIYCQFNPAGAGSIIIAYEKASGGNMQTIGFAKFDCGTNTFTLAFLPDLVDVALGSGLPTIPFALRADGSYIAVYVAGSGLLDNNVSFRTNVAGVWSGLTNISAIGGHTYIVQNAILDPVTQLLGVVWSERVGGVTTNMYGSVDSTNTIGAIGAIVVSTTNNQFGLGVIVGATIYLPVVRGSGSSKASVLAGTPLSAPVWTITDLDSEPGPFNITSVGMTVLAGQPVAQWAFENNAGTINVIRQSIFSGGAWGAFTVYYDVNALPPNAVPLALQFVSQVCPVALANGSIGSLVTMIEPVFSAFSGFFMVGGAPALVDVIFLGRIRDTYGNPVSDTLTLMVGGWANPWGAACGFPVDPDIGLESGGAVLFDLQVSSLSTGANPPLVTVSGALLCVRGRRCYAQ